MHNEQEQIRELLEAFRPGLDHLQSPEFQLLAERLAGDQRLQEQFERSQRLDGAVSAAMQDVQVPEGLADRLLDAVTVQPASDALGTDASSELPRRNWRRWQWLSAAAIVAGLAAILGYALIANQPEPITPRQLARQALQWTDPVAHSGGTAGEA